MSTAVALVPKIPGITMATIAVLEVRVTTVVMLECSHRTDARLERQGDGADVTRPATLVGFGRQEDGATHPLTLTTMSRLITTCIPTHQPDGKLAVPPDDWAQLRAVIEDEGGSLDLEETSKRGFIFGGHHGLPVYSVEITLPDEVDPVAAMRRIDPTLKAIIRRNLAPELQEQPA